MTARSMPLVPVMPCLSRNTANRVRARSGLVPPAPASRPVASRQRTHRLARSFSCGCGMPEKSRTLRAPYPRRCICHASRSYSDPQPVPSARSAICARNQVSWVTACFCGLPGWSRHSCRVRSSSDEAPLAARNLTAAMTTTGGAFAARSSFRRCSAYCTSSFSCGGSPSSRILRSKPGPAIRAAQPAANCPAGGRPRRIQVAACDRHQPAHGSAHSRHPPIRHSAGAGSGGLHGSVLSQSGSSGVPARFHAPACRTHRSLFWPAP